MIVMGLDPGGTTGVCVVDTDEQTVDMWELPWQLLFPLPYAKGKMRRGWERGDSREDVWNGLNAQVWEYNKSVGGAADMFGGMFNVTQQVVNIMFHRNVEQVVCEDFILRPGGGGGRDGITPAQYQFGMRVAASYYSPKLAELPWAMQTAAEGKGVMNDKRLKLERFGAGHARDAFRHVAHWMRKN